MIWNRTHWRLQKQQEGGEAMKAKTTVKAGGFPNDIST